MSIIGIDEAGRGALAGPVTAACVYIPDAITHIPDFIRDSKQLTPQKRQIAYAWIQQNCKYSAAMCTAAFINKYGIKKATKNAMQRAIYKLQRSVTCTHALIDGNDHFSLRIPATYIVQGDTKHACISAASIVAKVERDACMLRYHKRYPLYLLNIHKGYGTQKHYNALAQFGSCALHRTQYLRTLEANIQKYAANNTKRNGK